MQYEPKVFMIEFSCNQPPLSDEELNLLNCGEDDYPVTLPAISYMGPDSKDKAEYPPEAYPASGRYTPCAVMILAPNATSMSHTGTNTYILAEPEGETCIIVDPGPNDQDHFDNIVQCCLAMITTPVAVVLTHCHADHSEGAIPLAKMLGVPLFARSLGNLPDGPLNIRDFDLDVQIVSLPGHSADLVGLLIPQDKALVTGDAIFSWGSTIIAPDGGNLTDFFASLDRLEELVTSGAVETFLTAHGHIITDPLAQIQKFRKHRITRLKRIKASVEELGLSFLIADGDKELDEDTTAILDFTTLNTENYSPEDFANLQKLLMENPYIHQIYRKVYGDTDAALEGPAKRNIQVQLQYLRQHPEF